MKDLQAPSQEVTPRVPTELVSFDGAELLWIDAILFVPAIFGIMFLPDVLRAIALSLSVALVVTYFVLYAWARVHPTSFGARHVMAKPSRFLTDDACAVSDRSRPPGDHDDLRPTSTHSKTRVEVPTLQELFL